MKKFFVFLMIFVVVAGFCFAADPAEGFWISIDDKTQKPTAGWEIYTTGGKLFGKILSVADHPQNVKADKCNDSYRGFPVAGKVSEMTVVGTPWIFDLKQDRPGIWSGGNVIDPDDGRMYGCRVTFHAMDGNRYKTNTLEMRGTIGPFGRSQYWQSCSREEASSLR